MLDLPDDIPPLPITAVDGCWTCRQCGAVIGGMVNSHTGEVVIRFQGGWCPHMQACGPNAQAFLMQLNQERKQAPPYNQ